MSANKATVLGMEARLIARPFCLASAHAHPLSPPCYCLLAICPTSSSRKQKKTQTKKNLASRCFRCISTNRAAFLQSFVFHASSKSGSLLTYDLARINYYAMAPRRVINRNLRVIPFSQALCYSYFISISRNDHLRHPRRRQLLHRPESQPPTKGCPRMRHLWIRRTAHNQAIPPLWWLCTSLFCLSLYT